MTVLGDIAQATGSREYQTWEEIVANLPRDADLRHEELTLGYRAPGQILDFASRLLSQSAPSVQPTTSVRRGRFEPLIEQVEEADLERASIESALLLAAEGFLVGVIVPAGTRESSIFKAAGGDARVGRLDHDAISKPITIVPAPMAKGLEFDAVVVVEPAAIVDASNRGLRLLYVALTRPIQRLSVIHAKPLPELLADSGHGSKPRNDS
jgi:DNA helicase IV